MLNKRGLIFKKKVELNEFVSIRQPTVEMAALEDKYVVYSQYLCISTRELFSSNAREVDHLENKFPTMWEMIFDDEMNVAIGQMFGFNSADELFRKAVAFWTDTNYEDYDILKNSKKYIHKELGWTITRESFDEISGAIKFLTGYVPNEDLLAPKGISTSSNRKIEIWERTYKGRIKSASKHSSTIDDKVIILQAINAYGIDEIKNMSIYHFNKLYEALNEKEAYEIQWDVYVSAKFMPAKGSSQSQPKHWKSKFKT